MLDDQPAQAVMGIGALERPPVLFDNCADAGSSLADGDAAELFGRDTGAGNPAGGQLLDHHLHQMVFEQLSADDHRLKFDFRLESLNELPYPLDPELA